MSLRERPRDTENIAVSGRRERHRKQTTMNRNGHDGGRDYTMNQNTRSRQATVHRGAITCSPHRFGAPARHLSQCYQNERPYESTAAPGREVVH